MNVWYRTGFILTGCSETIKRLLAFPPDTHIVWKSHDDSIAQRSAIDQARQDKGGSSVVGHHSEKRVSRHDGDSTADRSRG